jgi:hypothetical protein
MNMSNATKQELNSAKNILGDPENIKFIACPEHPNKHNAALYCYPHKNAGIWECPEGYSDEHEHEDFMPESLEVTHFANPDTDTSYEVMTWICGTCGVQVEGRE